ncbi:MAG TPA: hypothetical protein PKU89_02965, partial [Kiritimatiellia bacterium]|nr:hypothetical protein [Kiritimatiellia bacterium]
HEPQATARPGRRTGVFLGVETFFPLCGKMQKYFSIVWKKKPFFSTVWKIRAGAAAGAIRGGGGGGRAA